MRTWSAAPGTEVGGWVGGLVGGRALPPMQNSICRRLPVQGRHARPTAASSAEGQAARPSSEAKQRGLRARRDACQGGAKPERDKRGGKQRGGKQKGEKARERAAARTGVLLHCPLQDRLLLLAEGAALDVGARVGLPPALGLGARAWAEAQGGKSVAFQCVPGAGYRPSGVRRGGDRVGSPRGEAGWSGCAMPHPSA